MSTIPCSKIFNNGTPTCLQQYLAHQDGTGANARCFFFQYETNITSLWIYQGKYSNEYMIKKYIQQNKFVHIVSNATTNKYILIFPQLMKGTIVTSYYIIHARTSHIICELALRYQVITRCVKCVEWLANYVTRVAKCV